jgi:hypothetical protein
MPRIVLAIAAALHLTQGFATDTQNVCPPAKNAAVATSASAIAIAKPELMRKFSSERVARYEPYAATLKNGVWHVRGHLPAKALGGTPEAQVCQSTGQVLSAYHTQ